MIVCFVTNRNTNIGAIVKIFKECFHKICACSVVADAAVTGSADSVTAANIMTGIFIVDIIGKAFALNASGCFISYAISGSVS